MNSIWRIVASNLIPHSPNMVYEVLNLELCYMGLQVKKEQTDDSYLFDFQFTEEEISRNVNIENNKIHIDASKIDFNVVPKEYQSLLPVIEKTYQLLLDKKLINFDKCLNIYYDNFHNKKLLDKNNDLTVKLHWCGVEIFLTDSFIKSVKENFDFTFFNEKIKDYFNYISKTVSWILFSEFLNIARKNNGSGITCFIGWNGKLVDTFSN
ncbi:hypothetical protein JTY60_02535 [symbiont of Argiope bruennichi]|uniref:hypothetical protein n=1 Tax=symbiont of Argiope bruennichi TaxID=2810479 RepID=UPI003DA1D8DC